MANIIKIADFSDGALDFYAREKEAQLKHRPAHGRGMFIAESPIVIERTGSWVRAGIISHGRGAHRKAGAGIYCKIPGDSNFYSTV